MSNFIDIQNEILPVLMIRNIHHQPVSTFSQEIPLPFGGDESLTDPDIALEGVGYNVDVKLLIKEDLTSTDNMPRWFNIPFFTEHVKIYTMQVISADEGYQRIEGQRYMHPADEQIVRLLGNPSTRKTNLKSFIRGATEEIIGRDWTATLREQGSMLNMLKAHAYTIMEESNYRTIVRIKEVSVREIKSGFEIGNKVVGAEDFVKDRAAVDLFHSVNSLSGKQIYDIPYTVKFEEDDKLCFINDGTFATKHVSYFSFIDLDVFGLAREINLNIVEDWYNGADSDSIINQFSGQMLHNVAWQTYRTRNVAQNEAQAEQGFESVYHGPPVETYAFFTEDGEQYFGSTNRGENSQMSGVVYTGRSYNPLTSKILSVRKIANQTITWDMMDRHDWVSKSIGDPFYDMDNPFNMGYGRISNFPEEISALSLAKSVSANRVLIDNQIRSRIIRREIENSNSDGISENMIHNRSPSGNHSFGFFLEVDRIIASQSRFGGLYTSWNSYTKRSIRQGFKIDSIRIFRSRTDIKPIDDHDLEEVLVVSGQQDRNNLLSGYKESGGVRINTLSEVDDFALAYGRNNMLNRVVRLVTFADGELYEKTDGKYKYRYEMTFQDPVYLHMVEHLSQIEEDIKKLSVLYNFASIPSSTGFFDETDFTLTMTAAEFIARMQQLSAQGRTRLGKLRDFSLDSVYGSTETAGLIDNSQGGPNPTALMISEKGAFNYKTGVYSQQFKDAFRSVEFLEKYGVNENTVQGMIERFEAAIDMLFPEATAIDAGLGSDSMLATRQENGQNYGALEETDRRGPTVAGRSMLGLVMPTNEGAKPEYILTFKNSMINLAMTLRKLLGDYSTPSSKISLDLDESMKTKCSSILEYKKEYRNIIDVNHNHNFSVYFLPLAEDGSNLSRRRRPVDAGSGQHLPVIGKSVLLENFRREYSNNSEDQIVTSDGFTLVNDESQYAGYLLPSKYYYTNTSLPYHRNMDRTLNPVLNYCSFNNNDSRFFTTYNFTNEHNKVKELYKIFRPSYGFVGTSKKDVRHAYVPHANVLKPEDAEAMRMFGRAQFNLADFGIGFRWDRSSQVLDEAGEEFDIQRVQRVLPEDVYEDLRAQLEEDDNEDLGLTSRAALREIQEYSMISRAYGKTVDFYDEVGMGSLTPLNMNDPYSQSIHTRLDGLRYRPFQRHNEWNWQEINVGPAINMARAGQPSGYIEDNEDTVPPHLLAAAHHWPRPPRDQGRGWGPSGRLMNDNPLGETHDLSYFYHGMLAKIMVQAMPNSNIATRYQSLTSTNYVQMDRRMLDEHDAIARTGRYLLCKISYYENNYFGIGPNILQKHIPISDEYFLVDLGS